MARASGQDGVIQDGEVPARFGGRTERSKNKADRLVVLNDLPKSVVEAQHGKHPEFMFTYKGHQLQRMNGHAWRKANARVVARFGKLGQFCGNLVDMPIVQIRGE